jgi:polyprenyl-phospho-N-acetylgalactosaminyl synthase
VSTFRPCAVVPTFDNPATIARVVAGVRAHLPDVIVVDDGSGPEGRRAVEALAESGDALAVHRPANGGKGAAVKTGLAEAAQRGFTHALQIDADGQHDLEDVPRFVAAARAHPEALVLGTPVFDGSAPLGRRLARQLTRFWTTVETLGPVIHDPMCGFRVYPVAPALAVGARGDAMDFDPEIAVRLAWHGVPVINLPTRVRYVSAAEGGVSHFRLLRDNVLITAMHTRLVIAMLLRPWRAARAKRLPA